MAFFCEVLEPQVLGGNLEGICGSASTSRALESHRPGRYSLSRSLLLLSPASVCKPRRVEGKPKPCSQPPAIRVSMSCRMPVCPSHSGTFLPSPETEEEALTHGACGCDTLLVSVLCLTLGGCGRTWRWSLVRGGWSGSAARFWRL